MKNEFAAFVAIDWAEQEHVWALEAPDASGRVTGSLDHRPESVDVWAAELRLRFSGQPVAVALEQSRGPLVFMLTKYEHLVLFPIHPTTRPITARAFDPRARKMIPMRTRAAKRRRLYASCIVTCNARSGKFATTSKASTNLHRGNAGS